MTFHLLPSRNECEVVKKTVFVSFEAPIAHGCLLLATSLVSVSSVDSQHAGFNVDLVNFQAKGEGGFALGMHASAISDQNHGY